MRTVIRLLPLFLAALGVMGLAACAAPTPVPAPTVGAATATPTAPPPAQLPAPGTVLPTPTVQAPPATPAQQPAPPAASPAAEPPLIGQPNRLVIPKIALDVPIVDVGWRVEERGDQRFTEWETAENAAGRHINSARPGEQGNVVLSGHHNTKGEVFRRISDLELAPGDLIYLYDQTGRRFTYVVDEVTNPPLLEVGATPEQRLANARYIQPTTDARVTLVTCWPYWTNTHRVVVVGKLVP
ncbi:MAG: sortase [Anaerolineae bacterium]|nr:sortase [Anaerolineae bacterium]